MYSRLLNKLIETFNTHIDGEWDKTGETTTFSFKLDDHWYQVDIQKIKRRTTISKIENMLNIDDIQMISLSFNSWDEYGNSSLKLTHRGNASKVMSAVIHATQEYLEKNKVDAIHFSSDKSSRSKAYNSIIKRKLPNSIVLTLDELPRDLYFREPGAELILLGRAAQAVKNM